MLNQQKVLGLIKNFMTFIIFVVAPFIIFINAMCFLSDDSAFGMFIRLFNIVALPMEILAVGITNLIGFFILKKENKWKRISFIYLLLQTIVSIIMTIYFYLKDTGIIGESVIVNDIVKPDSYVFHSMVCLNLTCIVSFCIIIVIYCGDIIVRNNLKNKEE